MYLTDDELSRYRAVVAVNTIPGHPDHVRAVDLAWGTLP
jgi:hypothetical protein